MVKGKPSVAEKREMARKVIQDAAMDLFLIKGYEATTTRDIIAKAGILNGSLYNRFKNKDEILFSIIRDAIQELLDRSKAIMAEENNLLLAASFPGALQIYLAARNRNLAELLYHVHRMWSAVEEYVAMNLEWSKGFLSDYGSDFLDSEQFKMSIMTLIGALGDMVGYYSHGGTLSFRDATAQYVLLVATNLKMPVMNIDNIVNRLEDILGSEEFVLLGRYPTKDFNQMSLASEDNN